jgi:hypothetical protein
VTQAAIYARRVTRQCGVCQDRVGRMASDMQLKTLKILIGRVFSAKQEDS